MDKVVNSSEDNKNKFEEKYSKEIGEIKERHAKEINLTKSNLIEVYEKKIEYYKERKDDLERRVSRLEDDLKDKSKSYDEVLVEYRML